MYNFLLANYDEKKLMRRLDVFISGKYDQNDRNAFERWPQKDTTKEGLGDRLHYTIVLY